jgi:hypothetical protein
MRWLLWQPCKLPRSERLPCNTQLCPDQLAIVEADFDVGFGFSPSAVLLEASAQQAFLASLRAGLQLGRFNLCVAGSLPPPPTTSRARWASAGCPAV